MAASLVATALQAIAMLPLLFLLYLAGKMGYILFKNILDRRAIEAAGVYVPKGDGYTWLKGHMDLFVTKGGSFTAVCAYLDKERPDVPDTFVTYISLFATILVSRNPEVAAQVLLRKNYPKDSYDSIKPIVGMGLLTTGGDHWVKKRRIMNHGFKPTFLESMVPAFASYSSLMCDSIIADIKTRPAGPRRNWVDMGDWFSNVALDIIGDVGFGHKFNFTKSFGDANTAKVKEMVFIALSEPSKQLTNPLRKFTHPRQTWRFYKELAKFHQLGLDIIKEAKKKTASGKEMGESNILDLILKMGQLSEEDKLSDQEMLDEILTFLVAGHETTASTASFALLYMFKHPEVLAKAVAEVDSILPTINSVCTYADQAKMEYLGAIMKEVLRLHPIAPAAMRRVPAGEVIDGHKITRDIGILIPYVTLHRSKEFWGEDADEFKPDRWLGESPIKHTFAYVPFSGGPRICIGKDFANLEFRVLIATFLRRFRYTVPRDMAFRKDILPTDPDFHAEPGDRAFLPLGHEVAFSEAITQRPRECVIAVEPREK